VGQFVIVPLELRELNALVSRLHRHHQPVQGHRFSLGVRVGPSLVGGVSVGRPVSRFYKQNRVIEVTRCVTDGTKNACSALYAAACRVGRAMGFKRIQTYTLPDESGASLRAAGFVDCGIRASRPWVYMTKGEGSLFGDLSPPRRQDQPNGDKRIWRRVL